MQRDVVKFEKGAVLRKEMLESMYNYPRILNESYYSRYNDGILYGLEWYEENGKHFISPGALKYKGEIYFQIKPIALEDEISEPDTSQEYYIYFQELPAEHSYSQEVYNLGLVLTKNPIDNGFCYKYIKYELKRIKALDNRKIYGLYASSETDSFGIPISIIKKEIVPLINEKAIKHPLDFELLKNAYANTPLPAEMAALYISEYNNSVSDSSDKIEIDLLRENVRKLVDDLAAAVKSLTLPTVVLAEKNEINNDDDIDDTERGRVL